MWPEDGEGFEASTFSPAGHAQVEWRLLRSLSPRGRRRPRWVRVTQSLLALMLAVFVVTYVITLVTV